MIRLLRRLQYWLHSRTMDSELAEEMEFHRAMLESDGSRRAAMGNVTLAREDARAVWISPWLESVWQDAIHAVRTLRREPGFTATALLALGSAIGLNTSLFTIFNAVALRPWPAHDPSRVVIVQQATLRGPHDFGIAEYRYVADHSRAFTGLIAMRNGERVKLAERQLQLTYVSGNYFRVLGVDLERGRGFLDEEDRTGAPLAVAVISHDLWQNQLGADPQVVGRTILVDEIPFTVVGVTSPSFSGTSPLRNDIWTPLAAKVLLRPNDPSVQAWLTSPGNCCTPVAGRLAPGIERARAQAEVAVLLDQFRSLHRLPIERSRVLLAGTAWIEQPSKKRQVVSLMATLFLALTLVLLLACANVGNLLLARASARRQEIATRLALGAGRSRLVRQLLVESVLLALAAAAIGSAIAQIVPSAVVRRLAQDQVFNVTADWRVLVYTIAVAALSSIAFGLAPALHGTRGELAASLRTGAGADGAQTGRFVLRSVLLSVQVAIGVVLLAGAGLLVRGMQRAQALDPGFDVQNVSLLSIDLPASEYAGPRTRQLTRDLLVQLGGAPDLPPWALAMNPPLSRATYRTSFRPLGTPDSQQLLIYFNEISGGFADALGMHLLAGRNFVPEDASRDVIIINEAAAKRWWPAENVIGKTVFADNRVRQIVGVISDAYTNDLASLEAVLYVPITGRFGAPVILVRDRGPAALDRVAAFVKQIEPRTQVRSEPLADSFRRTLQPSIYASQLAAFLGLLALAIASVGMSGVFAYVVAQRTREIGLRMALGAQPSQVVRLVLGSSIRALACGLACGTAGAAGISALLTHSLPGIHPLDPLAYVNVALLLSVAVALASAVPARRATHVDPVRALRWE
jgi:predicted permease